MFNAFWGEFSRGFARTYNPADKPAKNSSKSIKVRESKPDKKAKEKT